MRRRNKERDEAAALRRQIPRPCKFCKEVKPEMVQLRISCDACIEKHAKQRYDRFQAKKQKKWNSPRPCSRCGETYPYLVRGKRVCSDCTTVRLRKKERDKKRNRRNAQVVVQLYMSLSGEASKRKDNLCS